MIPSRLPKTLIGALCLAMNAFASGEDARAPPRPFFVFGNGLTDAKAAGEHAALLKGLGYDGIRTRPDHTSDVVLPAKKDAVVPEVVAARIRRLQGRGSLIWLGLIDAKADDETAVRLIRELCDLSGASGFEVALYPHVGFCTGTIGKCARLADMAERKNLG
jgi:hypothetical protein